MSLMLQMEGGGTERGLASPNSMPDILEVHDTELASINQSISVVCRHQRWIVASLAVPLISANKKRWWSHQHHVLTTALLQLSSLSVTCSNQEIQMVFVIFVQWCLLGETSCPVTELSVKQRSSISIFSAPVSDYRATDYWLCWTKHM
jgi:hypothetical protein